MIVHDNVRHVINRGLAFTDKINFNFVFLFSSVFDQLYKAKELIIFALFGVEITDTVL